MDFSSSRDALAAIKFILTIRNAGLLSLDHRIHPSSDLNDFVKDAKSFLSGFLFIVFKASCTRNGSQQTIIASTNIESVTESW
jgi:hypothetical protein